MPRPYYRLLAGDVCGFPSTYYAKLDHDQTSYAVVSVDLWEDIDSTADMGRYNVRSGIVDIAGFDAHHALPGYGAPSVRDALRSCGWELDSSGAVWEPSTGLIVAAPDTKAWRLCVLECMWGYGAFDRAFDESGNNLRALMREAKDAV